LEDTTPPVTSDQIYEKVAAHGVDRVTVFRNLTALEEQGILRRQDFGDGVRRFELHVREHHHHYIVCRGCGFSQPIDLCGISSTMEKEIKKMGFNDVRHAMSFSALCKSCA
jgi:Fe2+ or Zn2+ uptake regulation protein